MSLGKPKQLSSCCEKPAKVNMVARAVEGATRFHFCTHCGEPCDLSTRKTPFNGYTTISAVRKPTGEAAVFKELYAECGGRSVISGEPLLPPDHSMFHFQFAHAANKGQYPEHRLLKRNIFPVTVDEHAYQTHYPAKCQKDPLWRTFWKVRDELIEMSNRRLSAELSGKA